MNKQKMPIISRQLVFYNMIDSDNPLLFFEIAGAEKDVEEVAFRIRRQVFKMQSGIWDEKRI